MTEVNGPSTSVTEPVWPEFGLRVILRPPTQGPEKSPWRSDTYETPDGGGGNSQMLLSSSLVTVTAAYAHSYIKAR